MDRIEEYRILLNELDQTPPALVYTVQRAKARRRRGRAGRGFGIPLGSVAAAFLAFVVLVNVSTPFALACAKIPVLKDLTAAIAISPSLREAVEHDHLQYMGLSQTDGAITMTVEYAIVDQKQLNLFYRLESDQYEVMSGHGEFFREDGTCVEAVSGWDGQPDEDSGLFHCSLDFVEQDMPDILRLDYGAYPLEDWTATEPVAPADTDEDAPQDEPEPVAQFSFQLRFDPQYTQQGRTVEIGQWIALDGQRVYIKDAEIYPTHFRLNLEDDGDNTAWLKGLEFYLQDDHENRYEGISNGVSATGSADSPFYPSHRLESSYFGDGSRLTVFITGAEWLDKDATVAHVDLKLKTATGLPEGVTLAAVEGNYLTFDVAYRSGRTHFNPFGNAYWDEEGNRYEVMQHSTTTREGDTFQICFPVQEIMGDTVELEVVTNRFTIFDQPIAVLVE